MKKEKKFIFKKARAFCAPGLQDLCAQEINKIFDSPWINKKSKIKLEFIDSNKIDIYGLNIHNIYEILYRSYLIHELSICISDQEIFNIDAFKKFCASISWNDFLLSNSSIAIKAESFSSTLYHEQNIKKTLSEILNDLGFKRFNETEEQSKAENHPQKLICEIKKNKCSLFLSVTNTPLNTRIYKNILSKSAPIREDLALFCIIKSMEFINKYENMKSNKHEVFVPFGGTGTFIFEDYQRHFNISAGLIRDLSFAKILKFAPLETINFLERKSSVLQKNEANPEQDYKYVYLDNIEETANLFTKNLVSFKNLIHSDKNINVVKHCEDLFKYKPNTDFNQESTVFIPLNPPYGIRLGSKMNPKLFYKRIGEYINSNFTGNSKPKAYGFILCPNEETWSIFINTCKPKFKETFHIMHGGLDIRCCLFIA